MLKVGTDRAAVDDQCEVAEWVDRNTPLPAHFACSFNPTIVELPLSHQDRNANGIDDLLDILSETSTDVNGNEIPDEAELCIAPGFVSVPEPVAVRQGQTLTLSASSIGSPPVTFAWSRDGVPLADDLRITGATHAVLTVRSVTAADAGRYGVEVSNACGSITNRPVQVTIFGPALPQIQTRAIGQQVELAFTAEANVKYVIETCDNLSVPDWAPLELVVGDGTLRTILIPVGMTANRFYRVLLISP